MSFSDQLRSARERAGLSQQQLADRAGLPLNSIQNWEQNRTRPRLPVLVELARALGVSLDVLIVQGSEQPHEPRPRGRPRKLDAPATQRKKGRRGK